jgi:hypothetical protein
MHIFRYERCDFERGEISSLFDSSVAVQNTIMLRSRTILHYKSNSTFNTPPSFIHCSSAPSLHFIPFSSASTIYLLSLSTVEQSPLCRGGGGGGGRVWDLAITVNFASLFPQSRRLIITTTPSVHPHAPPRLINVGPTLLKTFDRCTVGCELSAPSS